MKVARPDTISGNLRYMPELRFTAAGNELCVLYLVDANGEVHYCVAWKEQATKLAEFNEGDRLTLTGHFKDEEYETSDNQKHVRRVFDIRVFR